MKNITSLYSFYLQTAHLRIRSMFVVNNNDVARTEPPAYITEGLVLHVDAGNVLFTQVQGIPGPICSLKEIMAHWSMRLLIPR